MGVGGWWVGVAVMQNLVALQPEMALIVGFEWLGG